MKKIIFLLAIVIPGIALFAFKSGAKPLQAADDLTDCLVKVKSRFGESCSLCGNSPDTYVVYIKNNCSKKLDIMIGVQEVSESFKWWRLTTFLGVNSSDTLRAYACKGTTGKSLRWAREAGDKSISFPTQAEVNEQYK